MFMEFSIVQCVLIFHKGIYNKPLGESHHTLHGTYWYFEYLGVDVGQVKRKQSMSGMCEDKT